MDDFNPLLSVNQQTNKPTSRKSKNTKYLQNVMNKLDLIKVCKTLQNATDIKCQWEDFYEEFHTNKFQNLEK